MKKLNLGCGKNRSIPDAVTVDINPEIGPDIVHDLNKFPWPFPDNEFHEIYCFDILEHLEDVLLTMEEIHRIGVPGGKVFITTPHFSSRNAFTDPTHRHFFGIHSFDYFSINGHPDYSKWNFYSFAKFEKLKVKLQFEHNFINKFIWRLAYRYPDFWERRLSWIFPAWFMDIELKIIKPGNQF
ncbi:MAG: methyltransferase domain-containing protein [bacterium]